MNDADFSSIEAISRRLYRTTEELSLMLDAVASARQIREYDSDRRKRALGSAVVEFLNQGESATAAEHRGRASAAYGEVMRECGKSLLHAERVIAEWQAKHAQFEALRSLLSVQKQVLNSL